VVDEQRLAAVGEVRVPGRPAVLPAPPARHPLLGDPDQHHPLAALVFGRGQVRPGDLLLGLALGEVHHRDLVRGDERLDVAHQPIVVAGQARRRGIG
jgi:hypothetical protein